jgi:Fur family peroxide stress response transcriptional regulator
MLKNIQRKGTIPGFKRTPQRLAILEYLYGNRSHPSADEIYRAVVKKNPSISFATVYNTLNTLVQAGAVRELTIDPERRRYDPFTGVHHHAFCLSCGKVMDISGGLPVEIPQGLAGEGFTVTESHIEYYGTCTACGKKGRHRCAAGAERTERTVRRSSHHGSS